MLGYSERLSLPIDACAVRVYSMVLVNIIRMILYNINNRQL